MEPIPICMVEECFQPRELIRVTAQGTPNYRQKCWRHRKGPRTEASRVGSLKSKYKLTVERYTAMLKAQNNCCAICDVEYDGGRNFAVDHDHACCPGEKTCGSCIRGLLCSRCNLLLGKLEADIDLSKKALKYIGI